LARAFVGVGDLGRGEAGTLEAEVIEERSATKSRMSANTSGSACAAASSSAF
jgi:hypothetical protein